MNKTDLIDQLADRLNGDRKTAQAAVENVIDLIQRAVHSGESVSISGFGVFEKRARAARTARNPRTGASVTVKKTVIPSFRPGKYFKDVIAGTVKMPKPSAGVLTARAAAAAAKAAGAKSAATRAKAAAAHPPAVAGSAEPTRSPGRKLRGASAATDAAGQSAPGGRTRKSTRAS